MSQSDNVTRLHQPTDIISDFMQMTSTDDTPDLYRKWSAITMVAGALERRVWAEVGGHSGRPRPTYPNLYIFLVGAPGVGKLIVDSVQELWFETEAPNSKAKAFHVAESNLTKASLMDRLGEAKQSYLPLTGPPYDYNCLLIAAEEFGVFMPKYDLDFVTILNKVYNNPEIYNERRRASIIKELSINKPSMTLLGGVQPAWLGTVFPEEAWGMGLPSRIIMVYGTSGAPRDPFLVGADRPLQRVSILRALGKLSTLHGRMEWRKEAAEMLRDWHVSGGKPVPTHSRLEHYLRRRTQHVIKLSIISTASRTNRIAPIESIDVERAIGWLLEAEKLMPDAFRAMIGKSDNQVIEELYAFVVSLYNTSKQSPIHEGRLYSFLLQRVPSDKIEKIILAAERAGMLSKTASGSYIPKSRTDFVE